MMNDNYVFICKNCGNTGLRTPTRDGYVAPCSICHSRNIIRLSLTVKEYMRMQRKGSLHGYILQQFPEEAKSWRKNLNKADVEHQSFKNKIETEAIHNNCIPKCPICGSTSLSKITNGHKVGKMLMFGIFGMGENGKTWKCNNCGSRF